MSDLIFGQPWHGRLTQTGLLLADGSLKTSATGTDANGAPANFSYYGPPGVVEIGHSHYLKVPGLPVPTTPPAITAIGGEFKNDVVMYGKDWRYNPFSGGSAPTLSAWLHYGADGAWRWMSLKVTGSTSTTVSLRVRRGQRFGNPGGIGAAENTVIADLTLTQLSAAAGQETNQYSFDARFDGRQVVLMRTGTRGNETDDAASLQYTSTPWENASHTTIVAVWRIDINADASGASATNVWNIELAEKEFTPVPADSYWATGPIYVKQIPSMPAGYYQWRFYEPFAGVNHVTYGSKFKMKRLIGCGFSPDGSLQLIEWQCRHDYDPFYYNVTGVLKRADIYAKTQPAFPASAFPSTTVGGTSVIDLVHTPVENNVYEIKVVSNGTVLHTMTPAGNAWPIWSQQLTNNVFSLRNASVSLARFGPGAADISSMALSPLYASYNPRANEVVSSTTPIGFV